MGVDVFLRRGGLVLVGQVGLLHAGGDVGLPHQADEQDVQQMAAHFLVVVPLVLGLLQHGQQIPLDLLGGFVEVDDAEILLRVQFAAHLYPADAEHDVFQRIVHHAGLRVFDVRVQDHHVPHGHLIIGIPYLEFARTADDIKHFGEIVRVGEAVPVAIIFCGTDV